MLCWPPTSVPPQRGTVRKHSTLNKCTFLQSGWKTLESNHLPSALAGRKECRELWVFKWLWQERKPAVTLSRAVCGSHTSCWQCQECPEIGKAPLVKAVRPRKWTLDPMRGIQLSWTTFCHSSDWVSLLEPEDSMFKFWTVWLLLKQKCVYIDASRESGR